MCDSDSFYRFKIYGKLKKRGMTHRILMDLYNLWYSLHSIYRLLALFAFHRLNTLVTAGKKIPPHNLRACYQTRTALKTMLATPTSVERRMMNKYSVEDRDDIFVPQHNPTRFPSYSSSTSLRVLESLHSFEDGIRSGQRSFPSLL